MEHRDIDYQYILDFYFIFVGIKDAVFLFLTIFRVLSLDSLDFCELASKELYFHLAFG